MVVNCCEVGVDGSLQEHAVQLLLRSAYGGVPGHRLVCRWDEIDTHASNTSKQLLEYKDFTDVTLVTKDNLQINL